MKPDSPGLQIDRFESVYARGMDHEKSISLGTRLGKSREIALEFLATGSFVPENVVRNQDLSSLGYDENWIVQRTGIRERRHATSDISTSDLALEAGERCLMKSGVDRNRIGLLVVSTMTPDYFAPSVSCLIQERLGLSCPCVDVNSACSGFIYAFIMGAQFIGTGTYEQVLIVGADVMSRVPNPADRNAFPLFGDGAGALLLGNAIDKYEGKSGRLLSHSLNAKTDSEQLLVVPGGAFREPLTVERILEGRHLLRMDGRSVYKWAVRTIVDSVSNVLWAASLTPNDIALVVPHQANSRIIDTAMDDIGIRKERVMVNLDRFGNTSAASIPLALDEAVELGRIRRGDRVLLCGFGAGLAWGACVIEW